MNRLLTHVISLTLCVTMSACSFNKQTQSSNNNQSPQGSATPSQQTKSVPAQPPAQPGDLQPGQASGNYTAAGTVVELKYAYAGRAQRFGSESLVVLLTENPIPPEALAQELKDTPLLEGEKLRGLEYVIDENGMWVRFHPGQYQESGSNKLKEYKVENDVVRGIDENDGSLSNGKYSRSVRFVAAITK